MPLTPKITSFRSSKAFVLPQRKQYSVCQQHSSATATAELCGDNGNALPRKREGTPFLKGNVLKLEKQVQAVEVCLPDFKDALVVVEVVHFV